MLAAQPWTGALEQGAKLVAEHTVTEWRVLQFQQHNLTSTRGYSSSMAKERSSGRFDSGR